MTIGNNRKHKRAGQITSLPHNEPICDAEGSMSIDEIEAICKDMLDADAAYHDGDDTHGDAGLRVSECADRFSSIIPEDLIVLCTVARIVT
jgi:hypothetical protein